MSTRVHFRAVVCEQGGQWPAVDLAAVDDGDGLPKQSVAVSEDGVVDLNMLESLDDGQRRAGQNGFLLVRRRVKETDIMIHVVDVLVAKTLHVLVQRHYLLDVSIMMVGCSSR